MTITIITKQLSYKYYYCYYFIHFLTMCMGICMCMSMRVHRCVQKVVQMRKRHFFQLWFRVFVNQVDMYPPPHMTCVCVCVCACTHACMHARTHARSPHARPPTHSDTVLARAHTHSLSHKHPFSLPGHQRYQELEDLKMHEDKEVRIISPHFFESAKQHACQGAERGRQRGRG